MKFNYEGLSERSGVYKIVNNSNGRIYIGSAKEFKSRWKGHENSLRNNKHSNKFLQGDFNKCGTEAFEFFILQVTSGTKEERLAIEEIYIKQYYDKQDLCYNFCKVALSPEGTFPRDSEERKLKRSEAFKNTWANPASREGMIEKLKERAAEPEYKTTRSAASKVQWNLRKEEMSAAIKAGKKENLKEYFFVSPEGTEHKGSNIMEFAASMNLDYRALYEVASNKAESHKGWRNGNKYQGPFNKVLHRATTHTTEKYRNVSIVSKDGVVLTGSLPEIASKAGLISKSLAPVIRGEKESLHGWKLYNPSKI